MTVSKVIRGEDSDSFDRWQVPGVDAPAIATATPPRPGLTVRELEELQRAAYDEGFAEGRAAGQAQGRTEGLAKGEQEARELVTRMRRVFDTLAAPVQELDEDVEQALTALALSIAQQIIRRELSVQPGEVLAVIREAVALLPLAERQVSVRLHPDDARFIRETISAGDEASAWALIDDPTISGGGCRVVSGSSQIDATLEQRLALLAKDLLRDTRSDGEGEA